MWSTTCPVLPGLVTLAETLEDARILAEDAIRGYLLDVVRNQMECKFPKTCESVLKQLKEQIQVSL